MRNRFMAFAAVLVTGASVWIFAGERSTKEETPYRVVIVVEGVHSREGIGQFEAISVVDREKIGRLETFFPNFRTHPSSEVAAGWKAGSQVYFDYGNGRTVRVTVSMNDDGKTWSIGHGDFKTNGDFDGFMKQLRNLPTPDRTP